MSADLLREAAKTLREHAEAATRGPWEPGVLWAKAGVFPEGLPPSIAPGTCAFCAFCGPPVHIHPDMDVNGRKMLGHVHRHREPYGTDTHISGGDFDEVMSAGWIPPANHTYITLMHPPVALALAEMLGEVAESLAEEGDVIQDSTTAAAVALARTILRRDS